MNNEAIERFDNDLFRASDGKWIKFSDHEYAVHQLQSKLTALEVVATRQREALTKIAAPCDGCPDGIFPDDIAKSDLALTPQSISDRLAEKERQLDDETHDAEVLSNAINGKGGYIELLIKEKQRAEKAERELAATIKAKQENDERFMIERDEARAQLATAREDSAQVELQKAYLELGREKGMRETLQGQLDQVYDISRKPIDASDAMDEIDALFAARNQAKG